MLTEEFSNGFSTLVNSYAHQVQFGKEVSIEDIAFDEYEKSFFLTKAQEEFVLELYNGRNSLGESFEQTEELRRYLADLVKEEILSPIETSNNKPLGIDSNSKFFTLPSDLWFITYENVILENSDCEQMATQEVYPVTQDEYHRIKKNPFRGANNRRSLRLDLSDGVVEIVSKYKVSKYYLRYLKKLSPIILIVLPDGLTINEKNTVTECQLNKTLHQKILERAVIMALQSKGINVNKSNNENK